MWYFEPRDPNFDSGGWYVEHNRYGKKSRRGQFRIKMERDSKAGSPAGAADNPCDESSTDTMCNIDAASAAAAAEPRSTNTDSEDFDAYNSSSSSSRSSRSGAAANGFNIRSMPGDPSIIKGKSAKNSAVDAASRQKQILHPAVCILTCAFQSLDNGQTEVPRKPVVYS